MSQNDTPRCSVLLPTRWRVDECLRRTREGLALCHDPSSIEYVFYIDHDDPETIVKIPEMMALPCHVSTIVANDSIGYAGLCRYVNACARVSTGDWLVTTNDDASVTTPEWDLVLQQYGDGQSTFAILQPNSNIGKHNFPIMSRLVFEAIGHVSPSPLYDSWLDRLGRHCGIEVEIPISYFHDKGGSTKDERDRMQVRSEAFFAQEIYHPNSRWSLEREEWRSLLGLDVGMVMQFMGIKERQLAEAPIEANR